MKIDVTAAIAKGKRPATFRTRKLSPPAPMVLHPQECGRVGRRRTFFPQGRPIPGAPEAYFRQMFELRRDLAGVDWAAVKADLARDRFDNGRTPEELRRSFAASAHVCLAWVDGRVVGTARVLVVPWSIART